MKLSIVIPCHNEEAVISDTYDTLKEIINVLLSSNNISDYEVVLVNNGSTDSTLEKMLSIQSVDEKVIIVDLRNNYGYQGSITAGLCNASGDAVVTIDADLQDDPYKIIDMVDLFKAGYEMVLGIRKDRKQDSFFKRITANFYYRFLDIIGVKSVYNHGDFRLLSKKLVEEFRKLPERNRYIRGLILELESRYACVYYERRKRKKGKSKFNMPKLISFAIDGITSFTSTPIRIITAFGLFAFILSFAGALYVLYEKLIRGVQVPGWAFISIVLLFYGGLQSLFLGIVGEYIAKTYIETKQRPLFLIRNIYKRRNDENDANSL